MPRLADKLHPLHDATKVKGQAIEWTTKCQSAFLAANSALVSATLLHHPHSNAKTSITVDASDRAVGGKLEQFLDGRWCPIAFFSRKLTNAMRKYSSSDRELLAIFLSVKHFRHHIEGHQFTIFTDHKPLTFAFASAVERSPHQTRHMSFISEFSTDVRHVSGKDNVVADALSRTDIASVFLPTIDYHQMAADQATSDEIAAYKTSITCLRFDNVQFNDCTILYDVSMGKLRPIVPREWTRTVLDSIHGLAHAGCHPTQRAISSRFVWHGLKRDVRKWCRECHPCQASKTHRHVHAPLTEHPPPDRRSGSLNIDLVGPIDESWGMKYFFMIIDRFTRWPEAIPLPDSTTETCARAFICNWISRFGVPDDITSDRGPQFTSHLWSELNCLLGISASNTTAYRPQANGLVERFHQQLKGSLKARLQGPHWMDELPLMLLGIRTAWREGSDCSASKLVYGTSLRIPGEFLPHESRDLRVSSEFLRQLQDNMRTALTPPMEFHGGRSTYKPDNLASTGYVYVRHDDHCGPLQRPYDGPFKILKVHEKYYVLNMNGHHDSVSIDRLKTAYGKQTYCRPALVPPQPVTSSHPTRAALSPPTTSTPQPTVHSRSGRPIKTPVRYL